LKAQRDLVKFSPAAWEPLAAQLGEVKTIAEILFAARVNSLDGIQRVRVSDDDASGPQADYFDDHSVTNNLAVLTPYQITFRSFSPEIAQVLAGFASSPHGFIVKRHQCSTGWRRGHDVTRCNRTRPPPPRHAPGDAGQGRIADGVERAIIARHAGGRGREIVAEKVSSWISSKNITRKFCSACAAGFGGRAGVPAVLDCQRPAAAEQT
jgi:hypothetical protein